MIKKDLFDKELQDLACFARVLSHPARIAILKYLAQTKTCISGDISDHLPLSRTTVSQHLSELKQLNVIKGDIDGLKVNYCLNYDMVNKYKAMFEALFTQLACCDNTNCRC
jgi:ArsR family transcriptional regulator, arsenate/arsenite/antimonite-responsive transcriptional repressor